jgi:hypothetical protein
MKLKPISVYISEIELIKIKILVEIFIFKTFIKFKIIAVVTSGGIANFGF